jgi:hypothetical protein
MYKFVIGLQAGRKRCSFPENAKNVVFAKNQIFKAVNLDFRAGILAEQNRLADFDCGVYAGAVVQKLAFAYGHNFALLGFFFGGIGNYYTAFGGFFLINSFDQDAVRQRTNVHV